MLIILNPKIHINKLWTRRIKKRTNLDIDGAYSTKATALEWPLNFVDILRVPENWKKAGGIWSGEKNPFSTLGDGLNWSKAACNTMIFSTISWIKSSGSALPDFYMFFFTFVLGFLALQYPFHWRSWGTLPPIFPPFHYTGKFAIRVKGIHVTEGVTIFMINQKSLIFFYQFI